MKIFLIESEYSSNRVKAGEALSKKKQRMEVGNSILGHGIIARVLSTQKVPHLTKPTSKTTCTKRNGPKAIQEQASVNESESNINIA
ncbi:hypothetical protein LXL04_027350 [Taraxacum kok-saghyz]